MSELPSSFPKNCRLCKRPLDFDTFEPNAEGDPIRVPARHEDLHGTVIACGNCGARHGMCP